MFANLKEYPTLSRKCEYGALVTDSRNRLFHLELSG